MMLLESMDCLSLSLLALTLAGVMGEDFKAASTLLAGRLLGVPIALSFLFDERFWRIMGVLKLYGLLEQVSIHQHPHVSLELFEICFLQELLLGGFSSIFKF